MKRVAVKKPNGKIYMKFACEETAIAKPPEKATMPAPKPKHLGGGWYQLKDGRKVRKSELGDDA